MMHCDSFRFWCNDDHDGSGLGEEQESGAKDSDDGEIKSERDLEDFFRLQLYIGGLQDAIKAGKIKVGLAWRNVTGDPSIRVYRAAEPNGGNKYLTDESSEYFAAMQTAAPFKTALGSVIDKTTTNYIFDSGQDGLFGSTGSGIPAFDVDHPTRNLIVEGVGEGKGQLVMTFYKEGSTTPIGEGGGVWLDIKNVKKMYERYKATPEGLPEPYKNNTGTFSNTSSPQKWDQGQSFEKPTDEAKTCLVYVHGWNTREWDATNTAETMFKRLWHQGFKGHFTAFRWDTTVQSASAIAGEYNRGDSRALVYGSALKQMVTTLAAQYDVSVVAHSMGNVVTGEALRQGMQVKNYLMMEAAFPASCYDSGAATSQRLVDADAQRPTPDLHSPDLGYRGYLQNIGGTITRYYNRLDYALATGSIGGAEANWEKNQIDFKPDYSTVQSWFYGYNSSYASGKRAWLLNFSFHIDPLQYDGTITQNFPSISTTPYQYRAVTDSFEVKSFVARSRTKAVGAIASIGGPILDNVNLEEKYGFQNSRADHSGQFTRRIQQVFTLYKDIYDRSKK